MTEERIKFEITTPIIAPDELGSTVQRVKLSKADKELVPELENAVVEYCGQETLDAIQKRDKDRRAGRIQKAVDALHRAYAKLHSDVDKSREDDVRRSYESKVVKLGEDPSKLTEAQYDKYLLQREKDQQLAAYIQKRDREGKI